MKKNNYILQNIPANLGKEICQETAPRHGDNKVNKSMELGANQSRLDFHVLFALPGTSEPEG